MESQKCGERRRKGQPVIPLSSLKYGGGSVMAWACMAASGKGGLLFVDDLIEDGSSRTNLEVSIQILSGHVQRTYSNLLGWYLVLQQGNDPKHTA